tara:strand:- start:107 stop:550 length:444 start_codon:yes stop_codon:yes gene_type:complete
MAEERYLKQYEKSATGNYLLKSRGILENTIAVAAARTLTQEESGSTILVNPAAAYSITLPADKAGLKFKFVYVASAANLVKVDSGAANGIAGVSMDVSAAVNAIDNPAVHFIASGVVGSVVELVCDGTTWFATCIDGGTNKITGGAS